MIDLSKDLIPVAHVNDLEDEEMIVVEVDDEEILICRVGDSFHAISNICSHAYVELSDGELDGCFVTCPLHFSQFDVRTGEPQGLPAKEPVQVYELSIIDERIYLKV
jgi:nitrite reductase/ring-hydroxylating ferredoxin subunit